MILTENKYQNFHLLRCSGGVSYTETLTELSKYAIKEGLAKEGHTEALLAREEQYPTGLMANIGVAIPHADEAYTQTGSIIVALLEKSSRFKAMAGGGEVDSEVIFLLMIDKPENQVKVLSNIVELIQDKTIAEKIKSPDICEILKDRFQNFI